MLEFRPTLAPATPQNHTPRLPLHLPGTLP